MEYALDQTFPTPVKPSDRFEDLIKAAGLRIVCDPRLEGTDDVSRLFVPEPKRRIVPIRLTRLFSDQEALPSPDRFGIALGVKMMERNAQSISLHALLRLVCTHRAACEAVGGACLPMFCWAGDITVVIRCHLFGSEAVLKTVLIRHDNPTAFLCASSAHGQIAPSVCYAYELC